MVKFVMCLTRHPDMSRKQFLDYWQNCHAPFFQSFSKIHNAKKYIQNHTLETPMNAVLRDSRGMMKEYDGIAEVWFDSVETFVAAMSTPEGQKLGAALTEDENKFVDHSKSTAFFAEEHEV